MRILATSRRRLGVAGERVERLGPLPEPDQVTLFADRASLLRAGFDLDAPDVRAAVAEVCRLVDGLPLAVELSASREAVFGIASCAGGWPRGWTSSTRPSPVGRPAPRAWRRRWSGPTGCSTTGPAPCSTAWPCAGAGSASTAWSTSPAPPRPTRPRCWPSWWRPPWWWPSTVAARCATGCWTPSATWPGAISTR
ncbi:MAG: hypothetical protein ACLGI2_14890 [Acidimicrobiia bacterium]